jgi:hypothetical protein
MRATTTRHPQTRSRPGGFVTFLHEQLLYEFQNLGEPRPVLWRDTRGIERGDQFEPLIEEAIAASLLLVVRAVAELDGSGVVPARA